MKRKLVYVEWEDSCSFSRNGWREIGSESLTTSKIKTIGWIVDETDTFITISNCISEESNCTNHFTIPRGCITKVKMLRK
jgi:hypothetical protein